MGIVNPVQSGAAWQVQLASQPTSGQYTFRQMWSQLLQYNPDLPVPLAKQWVNNSYRRVVDFRLWTGLMVKGVVNSPPAYSTGNVGVTNGSTTVTGNGTSWTTAMTGLQFRVGYQNPIYTIASVNVGSQTLTLDLPYGSPTQSGIGYLILMQIVSLGPNVKRVLEMVNQQQGYRVYVNVQQNLIDYWDAWRSQIGWTYMLGQYAPSADGSPQWELYPAPNVQQTFPFLAYNQPPDMVNDTDYPATFVRGDIIIAGALSAALRFKGRGGQYYDATQAEYQEKYMASELQKLARNDDNLYGADVQFDVSRSSWDAIGGGGGGYHQQHDFGLL